MGAGATRDHENKRIATQSPCNVSGSWFGRVWDVAIVAWQLLASDRLPLYERRALADAEAETCIKARGKQARCMGPCGGKGTRVGGCSRGTANVPILASEERAETTDFLFCTLIMLGEREVEWRHIFPPNDKAIGGVIGSPSCSHLFGYGGWINSRKYPICPGVFS